MSETKRLLNKGDVVSPDDEMLCDDLETWEPVGKRFGIGQKYDANFFVPMRRRKSRDSVERVPTVSRP